jgi:hypothetical protein
MDYGTQARLSDAFYRGALGKRSEEFLEQYGIQYLILPQDSPVVRSFDRRKAIANFGKWDIYYYPEHHMARYGASRNMAGNATNPEAVGLRTEHAPLSRAK